ncbi:MAG: hypothetical protein M3077_11775 [Candidatus Dormibacteraeota bacterium]|nr:hypothetical protein [Candidatus Dormibacteraeota bacterium]
MIEEANDEIRAKAALAQRRRRDETSTRRPYYYLDWLIGELEELHMAGKKRVPIAFEPRLLALAEMLPSGVAMPAWRTLIRHVIDQVFDLQEQLLRLRYPDSAVA